MVNKKKVVKKIVKKVTKKKVTKKSKDVPTTEQGV